MICTLREDGWCETHQQLHSGVDRDRALDPSDQGEAFRELWSAMRSGDRQALAIVHDKILIFKSPQPPPGILAKAMHFGVAIARHAMDLGRLVSDEQTKIRLEVCDGCSYNREGVCTHPKCGCNLSGRVASKTKWKSERCPDGKWPEVEQ